MGALKNAGQKLSIFLSGVSMAQKLFFIQNLGVMIKAGIPLMATLKAISEQTTNFKLKTALLDIMANVEKGNNFHESLARHPKIFDNLFINMVKAGETSGKLEEALIQVHQQMKKTHDLFRKVRGALIYPAIVIMAMTGIAIGMMIFVIPNITAVFQEMNATLPLATRILIAISNFMAKNILWLAPGLLIAIFLFWRLIKWRIGKYYWQALLLKLPIVGSIIKKINLARFARTLSSLLNTAVPIVKAIQTTGEVLGNVHYQNALFTSQIKIKQGLTMEEALADFKKLFPPVVLQMVAVGEKTGALDKILNEMAGFYEEEVHQVMNNLPSILEPVLILIIGGAVGAMAVAIIMPMYSLAEQM
ncbi:MAG: type II secretion system F family protein [bacterium]